MSQIRPSWPFHYGLLAKFNAIVSDETSLFVNKYTGMDDISFITSKDKLIFIVLYNSQCTEVVQSLDYSTSC